SNNTASYFGGGIRVVGTGSVLTLVNTTVSGNSNADRDGGGIHFGGASLTLINSTISGNASTGGTSLGGGIRFGAGTFYSYNSTIVGNTATLGGNVSGAGATAASGGSALATGGVADDINTTIEQATNSFFGSNVIVTDGIANLNNQGTDNLLLSDLADNGGMVQTHRPQAGS